MSALAAAIRRSLRTPRAAMADSPMRVLERRSLSGYEVFAQAIATTAPTASMIIVPTMLLSHGNPARALLTLAIVLALALLTALCLTQFTRRMISPGGVYSYLFQGIGTRGALLGGTAVLVKFFASASATLYSGTGAVAAILAALGLPHGPAVRLLACLIGGAVLLLVLIRGARVAALMILGIETVSIVFIVTLILTSAPGSGPAAEDLAASGTLVPFWLIALFSLVGFESATFLGSETKRPYVSVTRAVLWTPLVCGSLLLFAGWAAYTGRAEPLVSAYLYGASSSLATPIVVALQVALACSWFASSMASSNAAARLLFSLGIDRVAPRVLATVHRRFRTPLVAMGLLLTGTVTVACVAILVPLGTIVPPLLLGARVAIVVVYLLVAVAAYTFLHRIGESTPAITLACLAVSCGSAAALVAMVLSDVHGGDQTVLCTLAGILLVATVWTRRRGRWPGAELGTFDHADSRDLLPGSAPALRTPAPGALASLGKDPRPL